MVGFGGFPRGSAPERLSALSGGVHEMQSSHFTANAATLTADLLMRTSVLQIDESALSAAGTLTLPTVARMVAAGLPIGSRKDIIVQNGSSAYPISFAAGDQFTLLGDPTVTVDFAGGVARLVLLVTGATSGEATVSFIERGSTTNAITAARTLNNGQQGVFRLTDGAEFAITLPAPEAGVEFHFCGTFTGGAKTFTAAASTFFAGVLTATNTLRQLDGSTHNRIAFTNAIGGSLHFKGINATQWSVWGASGTLTVSAV